MHAVLLCVCHELKEISQTPAGIPVSQEPFSFFSLLFHQREIGLDTEGENTSRVEFVLSRGVVVCMVKKGSQMQRSAIKGCCMSPDTG